MTVRRLSLTGVLILNTLGSVGAPHAFADERQTLDEVVVVAEPLPATEERAPTSFATEIDPSEHTAQAETVTDALAESVGTSVRRFGGLGSFSTISIRGSASNQVQIYLDGIPLSRARAETLNLADLPLDSLQRIEVYRGSTPVGFSTAGIGGVVNLVTKKARPEPLSQMSASYGSFETRKFVASHTQQVAGFDVLAHVTYLGTKGDFSYLDDQGTSEGPDSELDDVREPRANNWFDSAQGLLKIGHDLPYGVYAEVTSDFYWRYQGLPPVGNEVPKGATLSELRSFNYLRFSKPHLIDNLDVTASLFGIIDNHLLSDPNGQLTGVQEVTDRDNTAVGGNTLLTYAPFAGHEFSWFNEISQDTFAATYRLRTPSDFPDQTRLGVSTALQDRIGFFDDRLLLLPVVRYQHIDDSFTTTTPAGQPIGDVSHARDLWGPSIGAQAEPWEWLALRGNLGRYERAPSFSELFGMRGFVNGNSNLRSEQGLNRDIGFRLRPPPIAWVDEMLFEYAYFNNDATDLIVFIQQSQNVFVPQNIGSARLTGHEVSAHTVALDHLRFDFNYTRQDTYNLTDETNYFHRQLPGRPRDEWYNRLQLFADYGKVFYELSLSDGSYVDQANYTRIPSRDVHTVGAAYIPYPWLTISFEARNITNNEVRDLLNFPLPGLSFFGTIQAQLGGAG